jgi:membrane protein YqaA with SNARE-associated domain
MPFPPTSSETPIIDQAHADVSEVDTPKPQGLLRRLYNWVLSWADSPHGMIALAGISFAESSFFPIPPDVLQVALSVSKPKKSFLFAAVSVVASVLGAVAGWAIGWGLWQFVDTFFYSVIPGFTSEKFNYVESLYQDNAFLWLILSAFTPIPFTIFKIAAGACSVPLPTLIIASFIGRGGRFFLVATIMRLFGKQARDILDKYLERITLLFGLLVLFGVYAVKFLSAH